jgi:hypothetical protein
MLKLMQILILIALFFLAGGIIEGSIRMPGLHTSLVTARIGRVSVGLVTFRPGRIYYRFVIT